MDTHLAEITYLVKDYAKIVDALREENRLLKEKNIELNASSFWKQREELKEENKALRQALSDVAASLGNGSTVSVEASLPFIKELPHEVKLVCDGLRKELEREKKTCNNLREELMNPPADVQEKVLDMLGINKRIIDLIERYNELRHEVERYLKDYGPTRFGQILQKHDEQNNENTQSHKDSLTEMYGVSYQAETDLVRNFYPKANLNEAYSSWQEVVKKYPNATIQRQVLKDGKVISVENQIPRGF